MKLKGKTIFITGGANGIGKDLVICSAKRGMRVFFCDIDSQNGKKLQDDLKKSGKDATFFCCDVSNSASVAKMFENIKNLCGHLDVLVNNAAIQTINTWDNMTDKEFDKVIDVNQKGVFYCMKYATKSMQNGSTIVNILSIYHNKARLDKYHYDSAKGGVAQLTRDVALALGDRGISVNAVYPGYVITPMNAEQDPQKAIQKNVLKNPNIVKSKTFANAVLDFVKDFSMLTTGQIFGVDAGRGLK